MKTSIQMKPDSGINGVYKHTHTVKGKEYSAWMSAHGKHYNYGARRTEIEAFQLACKDRYKSHGVLTILCDVSQLPFPLPKGIKYKKLKGYKMTATQHKGMIYIEWGKQTKWNLLTPEEAVELINQLTKRVKEAKK